MSDRLKMPHSNPRVQAPSTSITPSISKVRASQKLSLKQKINYWNMSMPQSQTSGSGTQHYKHREPAVVIDLTEEEQPSSTSSPNPTSQSFDIDQKAKDKYNRLFDKFSSPMVPSSKPAGKQNWYWGNLDNNSKATAEQTQPSMTDAVPGKEESSTGIAKSIFGPRKPAGEVGVNGKSMTTPRAIVTNNSDEADFRDFTKFPKEIRDMIWKLSFPPPQVVTISKDCQEIRRISNAGPKKNAYNIYRAKATYQIPTLLHACQESREVGLQRYSRAFKEQLGGRPAYFDYKYDVLFFISFEAMKNFYGGTLIGIAPAKIGFRLDMNEVHRNVERVAIVTSLGDSQASIQSLGWTFNLFLKLKMVLIQDQMSLFIYGNEMLSCIEGRSLPVNLWSELVTLRTGNLPEVLIVEYGSSSINTSMVRAALKQCGMTW